jgi:hypothetical protein
VVTVEAAIGVRVGAQAADHVFDVAVVAAEVDADQVGDRPH